MKQIQRLLDRSDFDQAEALKSHRKVLQKNLERTGELIRTIDKTLAHMKGKKKMKHAELFRGFDEKKQAEYEQQLIERFGEGMRKGIAESRRRVKDWTKSDWQRSGNEWNEICARLVQAMGRKLAVDSDEVQGLIRRHYEWLKKFWTPNRESYAGHGRFLLETDLRKAYDKHDPKLAGFMAEAMSIFAEQKLV